ncbi:MAG TPA: biotin transporter BioY [Firmicutes bacterium]|nr:biotin transporter BioY [Bacillota bacterium]
MEPPERLVAYVLCALFGAVTAVLSLIKIPLPFTPIPVTGQSLGPMLAGLVLGPKYGAISQIVYVLLGVLGLPVFANKAAGPGVVIGPSGGYIWGFVVGAWVTGTFFRWSHKGFAGAIGATIAGGILSVYVLGVAQLCVVARIPIAKAILLGALPFIPGDLLKVVIAATSGPRIARLPQRLLRETRRERPDEDVDHH